VELDSLRPFLILSAVAAVALVIWIAIYRAKISPAGASRSLEVLETTMLGQGATLQLVRIGTRRFAIARTAQHVELLCELEAVDESDAMIATASRGSLERFRRLLGR